MAGISTPRNQKTMTVKRFNFHQNVLTSELKPRHRLHPKPSALFAADKARI